MSTPPTTTKKYLITSRQPNCNIDVKSTYDERKKSGYDIKSKYNNIVDPICQRDANKYTPVNKKNTAVTQNYYDILGRKKAFRNRKVIPHKSSMQTSSMIEKDECLSPQKHIFKFVNKPNQLGEEVYKHANEKSKEMLIPICVTAALTIILGIYPNFGPQLYDLASMAAEAITVGWTGGGW